MMTGAQHDHCLGRKTSAADRGPSHCHHVIGHSRPSIRRAQGERGRQGGVFAEVDWGLLGSAIGGPGYKLQELGYRSGSQEPSCSVRIPGSRRARGGVMGVCTGQRIGVWARTFTAAYQSSRARPAFGPRPADDVPGGIHMSNV